nr:hypothetical protein [Clostridia bacterium]
MLKCGIYEMNITPALGMEMPGYFSVRNATGVKEELYSEAVYFENDGQKAVIVSNDTIRIPREAADSARAVIAEKLEMPPENILFCATHTHTGGPVETWGDYVHKDAGYVAYLGERMADAAVLASAQAREVRLSYAKCLEDKLAYYRNYVDAQGNAFTWGGKDCRPFGDIDPEVGVLRIDHTDGSHYGVIVNYACHCDCVGGTEYSSDYPGEMRKTLRKLYGDDFRPVFVNGFCGNINHCDPNGFHQEIPRSEHYKRMGRMLAADVARTLELAVHEFEDNTIAGALHDMQIDARIPEQFHLDLAARVESEENPNHQDVFYRNRIRYYEEKGPHKLSCPVQVIKIGELAFYGMPGEIYVEFGKMLKERSPIKYNMPANLSNDNHDYVPIRELIQPGVYEARLGVSNNLIPDAGYMMVDELIEMAKKLK